MTDLSNIGGGKKPKQSFLMADGLSQYFSEYMNKQVFHQSLLFFIVLVNFFSTVSADKIVLISAFLGQL